MGPVASHLLASDGPYEKPVLAGGVMNAQLQGRDRYQTSPYHRLILEEYLVSFAYLVNHLDSQVPVDMPTEPTIKQILKSGFSRDFSKNPQINQPYSATQAILK